MATDADTAINLAWLAAGVNFIGIVISAGMALLVHGFKSGADESLARLEAELKEQGDQKHAAYVKRNLSTV